jgi:hypothetical protein
LNGRKRLKAENKEMAEISRSMPMSKDPSFIVDLKGLASASCQP